MSPAWTTPPSTIATSASRRSPTPTGTRAGSGSSPPTRRLAAHVDDVADYGARYPVPTVSMREPTFVPGVCGEKMVWRGPTWINTNWYLARGLRRHGREDLALRIEDASAELVEKSGFRE